MNRFPLVSITIPCGLSNVIFAPIALVCPFTVEPPAIVVTVAEFALVPAS